MHRIAWEDSSPACKEAILRLEIASLQAGSLARSFMLQDLEQNRLVFLLRGRNGVPQKAQGIFGLCFFCFNVLLTRALIYLREQALVQNRPDP